MCLLSFSPFLYYINKSLHIKIWFFSQRQILYNVSIFRSNCGNIFIRKQCWGTIAWTCGLEVDTGEESRDWFPLCKVTLWWLNSCTKRQLKKRKTKIQFLFWNTFVVLWRMYFIFFSFSLLQIFLKKHLSNGSIYLNLTGATGFCISVLCCEILTLT